MPKGVKYGPEFRAQACRQVLEFSRPIREVSAELGISHETLRTWLRRVREEEIAVAEAEESELEAEIRELKKLLKDKDTELYWAREENRFLEKAAGFFAARHRESGSR